MNIRFPGTSSGGLQSECADHRTVPWTRHTYRCAGRSRRHLYSCQTVRLPDTIHKEGLDLNSVICQTVPHLMLLKLPRLSGMSF